MPISVKKLATVSSWELTGGGVLLGKSLAKAETKDGITARMICQMLQ